MEGAVGGSSGPSTSSSKTAGTKCVECEDPNTVVEKAKKFYCKGCWKHECEFKFRKKLLQLGRPPKGSTGLVFREAENALVYYDGSPASVANINLLLSSMLFNKEQPEDEHEKSSKVPYPFNYNIICIFESRANGGDMERQRMHLHALHKWARSASVISGRDIVVMVTSLEMALKKYHPPSVDQIWENTTATIQVYDQYEDCKEKLFEGHPQIKSIQDIQVPLNDVLDRHLYKLIRGLKTKTDKKDFKGILKMNYLSEIAVRKHTSKVLLPENQTSLAVKQFTMMALGRGCQVADEMAFTNTTADGTNMVRPLIDFTEDDLNSYLETLDEQFTNGLLNPGATRKMKIDNVERQCDDFIVKLQKDYPATVSTLTKIGAKLEPPVVAQEGDATSVIRCQFCKRISDAVSEENSLCYGCQHFLYDDHPDKMEYFKQLFQPK